MTFDINAYREKQEARTKKWTAIHLEDLKEKFPDLIIDESKCNIVNVTDLHYQVSNEEYYYSSVTEGTYKSETEYTWQKKFLNDMNEEFKIVETDYYIYLISDWNGILGARVSQFFKQSGKRVKGVRGHRATNKTKKGLYICLNKKRIYMKGV